MKPVAVIALTDASEFDPTPRLERPKMMNEIVLESTDSETWRWIETTSFSLAHDPALEYLVEKG